VSKTLEELTNELNDVQTRLGDARDLIAELLWFLPGPGHVHNNDIDDLAELTARVEQFLR
jgi:hypothetical protein